VYFSFPWNLVLGQKNNDNNNNNTYGYIYGAVITTQSHCNSSPGSLDEYRLDARWLPTLTPSQTTWL